MRTAERLFLVLVLAAALPLVEGCAGCGSRSDGGSGDDDDDDGASPTNTPFVAAVAPTSGLVATTMTVTGEYFGAAQQDSELVLAGEPIAVDAWSDTQIEAEVPPTAMPGLAEVRVLVGGSASNAVPFRVLLPQRAFVNNDTAPNTISVLSIDTAAQPAVIGTPVPTGDDKSFFGSDLRSIHLDPANRRLFAANEGSVAVFEVDGATGGLTGIAGSPFPVSAGAGTATYSLTVSPDGDHVFVPSCSSMNQVVSVFAVSEDGSLSEITGSPFAANADVCTVAVSPDGSRLYAPSGFGSELGVFDIGADGSLTAVAGSPFAIAGDGYTSVIHPSGGHLFLADYDQNGVAVYGIDALTGVPTELATSPYGSILTPDGIAISPEGAVLYVADPNADPAAVHVFDVAGDGSLAIRTGSPYAPSSLAGHNASSLVVSADGAFLVALSGNTRTLLLYELDATGFPVFAGMVGLPGDSFPSGVTVSR